MDDTRNIPRAWKRCPCPISRPGAYGCAGPPTLVGGTAWFWHCVDRPRSDPRAIRIGPGGPSPSRADAPVFRDVDDPSQHDVIALTNLGRRGQPIAASSARLSELIGRRAFTAGIPATLIAAAPRPVGALFGFRVDSSAGDDGRFMRSHGTRLFCRSSRAVRGLDVQHLSLEIWYTFVVVSVATYRLLGSPEVG